MVKVETRCWHCACAILMCWSLYLPAQAESVSEVLRARLEPVLQSAPPLQLSRQSGPRALAEFYAARHWQPAWDEPRYQALLVELGGLYKDGLEPEDYGHLRLLQLPTPLTAEQKADQDILATRACLLALLHLYRGKVNPLQLDPHWNLDMRELDPQQGLQRLQQAVNDKRLKELFDYVRPAWPYYQQLRTALAQLRSIEAIGGWPVVPTGPALEPGMRDARVALLRRRLQLAGFLAKGEEKEPQRYDEELQQAVRRFQQEAYLDADGTIGPATLAELNVPLRQRIDQLRVNLERMRWFRNELRERAVIVDLAGYAIYYLQDGELRWRARVQIGREYRPSPVFQSTISHLTLSPAWTVPPTIFHEDILPEVRRDPGYLARRKLRVLDAAGQEIPPSDVNWSRPGNILLRQEPGPDNALGELAIRFANPFSVYLHDTPSKSLFNASRRSTSSGCIRVENIHELALLLLDDAEHWSREALQATIRKRKTKNVPLARKVTILLGYWTAQAQADGHVSFRPDVYRRDPPLLKALNTPAPL